MAEYHFPVPGSVDEEKIVLFVHRHWASFLGQFFLSFLILFLPILIIIMGSFSEIEFWQGITRNLVVLGLSIYYLVAVTFSFMAWITFYYDIYIICEDRIVDITQQGFFGRKISQLSLLRVQDVTSDIKGVFPTLFGYGNILVETAGEESQNFLIKYIPNPQEVSAKIIELHSEMVDKESRQNEHLEAEGVLTPGKVKLQAEKPATAQPSPPPPSPYSKPSETTYQKLLAKDQPQPVDLPQEIPPPAEPPKQESKTPPKEGEVSSDDLDKGGEIELK